MIPQEETTLKLLNQILKSDFYAPFIEQVKKDFEFSGQPLAIDNNTTSNDLVKVVYHKIQYLLKYNFDTYLQLLYRVDVSENLMSFDNMNSDIIAQKATFYILQREWQKILLRKKFT